MWQQWVNALLGLWVIVLGFLGLSGDTFVWTLAVTGIAIAALGVWGAMQSEKMEEYRERMA